MPAKTTGSVKLHLYNDGQGGDFDLHDGRFASSGHGVAGPLCQVLASATPFDH